MRWLSFPGARHLGAPPGWDQELDGRVGVLPVADSIDIQSGQPWMHSVWKPDADELALLAAGGSIRLGIMGSQHPVVSLAILTPEVTMICDDPDAPTQEKS